MPGAYRLILKTPAGVQLGILSVYQSLIYTKRKSYATSAILVARYGVTDATDELLDMIEDGVLLEVWRHPDPSDPAYDWYCDWVGLYRQPKKDQEGAVITTKGVWHFVHATVILKSRRVMPPTDAVVLGDGRVAGGDKFRVTGPVENVMRDLVRKHAVIPDDPRRKIAGLYVEANTPTTLAAGHPGIVFGSGQAPEDQEQYAVTCAMVWGDKLYMGSYSPDGTPDTLWYTLDGDSWTWPGGWVDENAWSYILFDDGGGDRMFVGTGRQGSYYQGEIWRSDVADPPTAWTRVWNPSYCSVVPALCVHGSYLYAAAGWGRYYTGGTYYGHGQIRRSSNGTTWNQVQSGLSAATVLGPFYLGFNSLCSWNGYLYAGATYYYNHNLGGGLGVIIKHARILRSQSGDAGTWDVVFEAFGPDIELEDDPHLGTVSFPGPLDGVACLAVFGSHLYAGIGDRWHPEYRRGRIYRSSDGLNWEQVFGADFESGAPHGGAGVTALATFGSLLWAGTGGDQQGDAFIWYSADGLSWNGSFDGRGMGYFITNVLQGFKGNLYAGFGWAPNHTTDETFNDGWYTDDRDLGDMWRMTEVGWDAPNWSRGISGRFPDLLEVLSSMAESTMLPASSVARDGGLDFELVPVDLGGDVQEFMFRVSAPEDHRSTSAVPVIFGLNRGNMSDPYYTIRGSGGPTMVYVLGEGQNEGRKVSEFHNTAAQGRHPWARVEGVVDAQGVETPFETWIQAASVLAGEGPIEEFGFKTLQAGGTRLGIDWDVGTLVTAKAHGLTAHCKIESVTIRLGTNPVVEEIDTGIRLLEIQT